MGAAPAVVWASGVLFAALFVVLHDEPAKTDTGAVPVVVVGADCGTLGAAGITEQRAQAYCAKVSGSDQQLWSLYSSDIPKPTGTGDVPVQVCVQQTTRSESDCLGDIARENADPAANDTLANDTTAPTS